MIDFIKLLLCYLLAQCHDTAGHREMESISRRVEVLERGIARERRTYWRPRDTFGG